MKLIGLDEFMKLSPEQRKEDGKHGMWKLVEASVTEIARARRTAELTYGIENEEFDEKLNEMCAKAYDRFCNMNQAQMATEMLKDLINKLDTDDLVDFLGIDNF